ncbi:MAG: lysophospholipid acyltransferase family protein [candidate division Zixibacteria bacterium]|nr:lysophospholipid acyltransferase family protein [candidate division Zixibacteria bacterium]
MKISHGIEYALTRIISAIFRILPRNAAIILGDRIGRATDNIWLSRHKVIINNLKIAFGDSLDDAKRDEIARDVFGNIGKTLAEVSRFSITSKEETLKTVGCKSLDVIQEVIDYGKGGIITGSHFGNWELVGAYLNFCEYPVDFLVRSQHNKLVDKYLTELRKASGARVIQSDESGGMKEILRALKNNRQICMVSDQHAGSQGIIINFFGRPVSVPRAPATLSVRTGAPIITGYILRNDDNTHSCEFEKPLYPDMEADKDEEIYRLTKIYTNRIEASIRAYPSFWLWTHRRFKYKPDTKLSEGSFVE